MQTKTEYKPTVFPKFKLGQMLITPGAVEALDMQDIHNALIRHAGADWGLVDEDDFRANNQALADGDRLLSAYESNGERFWIITEWDRSVTTVLLPEEY